MYRLFGRKEGESLTLCRFSTLDRCQLGSGTGRDGGFTHRPPHTLPCRRACPAQDIFNPGKIALAWNNSLGSCSRCRAVTFRLLPQVSCLKGSFR